ncbi:Uncharacterised protein [Vibrio cholerae]|uniref:Uncharacterized protein n=1 Tax=Vibrio cholerae TaxID=666 RepID=A0A656AMD2_VIBCL|nr:Uncharacterised protein [Vibrio cholerae]CSC29065.1 Uncharacterised protein [Vibrio cholerae]CSD20419.1 Uncharacterised protein [Vibrio cholerae]CSD28886.1 Uncharacterised protein [Vibrio cholerae]CSI49492.1 Uncharacterised protein [Vibrio cholerae]
MTEIVLTGFHHIKHAQRCFVFVGRVDTDLNAAIGHFSGQFRHVFWCIAEDRSIRPPRFGQRQFINGWFVGLRGS